MRERYAFSNAAKDYVHQRAGTNCEYGDGDCPNPNTGRVNHITGAFEGFLKGANPRDIRDPDMNATMECLLHEAVHDAQEQLQVQKLLGDKYATRFRRRNHRTQSFNQRRFTQRRRR